MLQNRFGRAAVTVLAGGMLMGAAACGGGGGATTSATPTDAPSSAAPAKGVKVGLAYDIGGRGDQSFNDAAAVGLDRAKTELGLAAAKELEAGSGETEAAKEERLRLLAQSGFNPVIAIGFAYSGPMKKIAPDFPDIKFAIVDDAAAVGPNISNLLFAEHEGSFLAGAAAALKTKKEHIGFVGGVRVPLIQKFEAGFVAGAKKVRPDVQIDVTYLSEPPEYGGFNDPAKGKTAAAGMFDAGADVVYHAAGGSGGGVFEAAMAPEGVSR